MRAWDVFIIGKSLDKYLQGRASSWRLEYFGITLVQEGDQTIRPFLFR
jgi:hypothetical protein